MLYIGGVRVPLSGKELVRLLKREGWCVIRIQGSHCILSKGSQTVSVPVHGNRITENWTRTKVTETNRTKEMMEYFAKITRERGGGYLVEFPDLPGCLTEGPNLKDAQAQAQEALIGWLSSHCDRSLGVPHSKKRRGKNYHRIPVPLKVEFAIRLRHLRQMKKLSQSEIARRLGISQQAYAKFEVPESSNPSLNTLQRLSDALDAEIEILLVA